jgi:hypothetical protein
MHPNINKLVNLILTEIKSSSEKKEKWAFFKNKFESQIATLLQLQNKNVENPCGLINIDFDDERKLILLNYTGQAHNRLHEIEDGWTPVMRKIRGIIFSYEKIPKMVSCGFDKFFNYNELPECSILNLKKKYGSEVKFSAREKADGHMIQYFVHNNELCASTRGKFGTRSSDLALQFFSLEDFNNIKKYIPNLMTVVVELVHPETHVHVEYKNSNLYLLALIDTDGNRFDTHTLRKVINDLNFSNKMTLPLEKSFTIDEMVNEINNREIKNREGWVVDFNGYLVKFKYINYIGDMVKSKLSHKYIMNCIKNNRLDKMLITLEEEVRAEAYQMVENVKNATQNAIKAGNYKPLYQLYNSELDGSKEYFTQVCRTYWNQHVVPKGLTKTGRDARGRLPPLPFAFVG